MSSDKAKLFSFSEMLKQQERASRPQPPEPAVHSSPPEPSTTPLDSRPQVAVHTPDESPSTLSRPHPDTSNVHSEPSTVEAANRPQTEIPDGHTPRLRTATQRPRGRQYRSADGKPSTVGTDSAVKTSTTQPVDGHTAKQKGKYSYDRHGKSLGRYDNRIDPLILKEIKRFCVEQDIDQRVFAELSAVHFMECKAVHTGESVDGKPSLDELRIFKTDEDIIMLYQRYTGNKWKPNDDREAVRFNQTDRRILEIGLIQTLGNFKGKRINSFAYFIPEIDMLSELNMAGDTLDIMLKQRKGQYERMFQK